MERDEFEEASLLTAIQAKLKADDEKRGHGLHASDLLDPRLAYWRHVLPKEISEREAWFFIIGKSLHGIVLGLADPAIEGSDSGTSQELGIFYSPDLIAKDGYPVELKTNRAQAEPENLQEEYHHYFEQLALYLVLTNSLKGSLWVLYLSLRDESKRTFPAIRCYRITLTEDQFFELERQTVATRDLLEQAKRDHTPTMLAPCRQWRCATQCPYWNDCKPEGRWPALDKRKWTT